jgi:hypothetical protein
MQVENLHHKIWEAEDVGCMQLWQGIGEGVRKWAHTAAGDTSKQVKVEYQEIRTFVQIFCTSQALKFIMLTWEHGVETRVSHYIIFLWEPENQNEHKEDGCQSTKFCVILFVSHIFFISIRIWEFRIQTIFTTACHPS